MAQQTWQPPTCGPSGERAGAAGANLAGALVQNRSTHTHVVAKNFLITLTDINVESREYSLEGKITYTVNDEPRECEINNTIASDAWFDTTVCGNDEFFFELNIDQRNNYAILYAEVFNSNLPVCGRYVTTVAKTGLPKEQPDQDRSNDVQVHGVKGVGGI